MHGAEEFVEVPSGRLWTATSGFGAPVLLCHGGPGAYDYLEPVAQMVDDLARVHRFDQRGGGRSLAGGPCTVVALTSDMELLRRHWGYERWLVAGHSWGAHLALFYAIAYPERTRALVLLNSTGVRWGWGDERRANRMRRLTDRERGEVERLEGELTGGAAERARASLRQIWWLTDFADRNIAVRSSRYDTYPTNPVVVESLEQSWQEQLRTINEKLSLLAVPALVLHGEADPIGEAGPRALARLLPKGQLNVLSRAGHLAWLEQPEDLRFQLRAFIRQHA